MTMMTNMKIKTYHELIRLPTFEERYEYLKLSGIVGASTFGFDRYVNQAFYHSKIWRETRDFVIVRDSVDGYPCDLAHSDHPIVGRVIIHHMNPITLEDLEEVTDRLLDPDFLVCTFDRTHNAIHYGDESLLPKSYVERRPNDTCPWRT